MMNGIDEALLHFIWRFQHFDRNDLRTSCGQTLDVYLNGYWNHDAGPDFMGGKVKLGEMLWFGNVEIHVRSSDWKAHGHEFDANYNNVILHVVWEENELIKSFDGQSIPTLVLKDRVNHNLLGRYRELMYNEQAFPCASQLINTRSIDWESMIQSSVVERLEVKAQRVFELLRKNKMDWEETTYQLLASNFGFKINNTAFMKLAQVLSIKKIKKHSGNLFQIEALLFGSSGLLDAGVDDYQKELKKEYDFLAHKYGIRKRALYSVEWKKLRLRPGNFPTVRIAQLAALIDQNPHFFNTLIHTDSLSQVQVVLQVCVSSYWQKHYDFGKPSSSTRPGLMGMFSVQNLIINTAVPILMAYSKYSHNPTLVEQSLNWLETLSPENNKIIRQWKDYDRKAASAMDSQGMIHLYNEYCLKKKCLSCKIGVGHLNRE